RAIHPTLRIRGRNNQKWRCSDKFAAKIIKPVRNFSQYPRVRPPNDAVDLCLAPQHFVESQGRSGDVHVLLGQGGLLPWAQYRAAAVLMIIKSHRAVPYHDHIIGSLLDG